MHGAKLWLGIGGLVVLIGCAGLLILPDHVEVLEKGQLLSYTNGRIYHIRLFNTFELYVEPSNRLSMDVVTTYILLAMSFTSFAAISVMLKLPSQDAGYTRAVHMLLFLGLGTHYLAIDEYFGLHETMGHNLQWLRHLPGVVRPDDVIIVLYVFPALIFLYKFHDLLQACRGSLNLFLASIVLFAGSAITDLTHIPGEEALEVLTGGLLLGAVFWLSLFYVERAVTNYFAQERTGHTVPDLSIAKPERDPGDMSKTALSDG